jgi:hypothetical protein
MSADSCKGNGAADCPYPGNNFCTCPGNGNGTFGGNDPRWICQLPNAACPMAKPLSGMLCGPVRACNYADDACFCDGTSWGCESG